MDSDKEIRQIQLGMIKTGMPIEESYQMAKELYYLCLDINNPASKPTNESIENPCVS